MPASLSAKVTEAAHSSFMGGLHAGVWVGLAVALVGAALALLGGRNAATQGEAGQRQ